MKINGPRLKEARIAAGFKSQGALGERVGLNQRSISDLENSTEKESTKVYEIVRACGVSVEWLTGRGDGEPLKQRSKTPSPSRAALHELTALDEPAGQGIYLKAIPELDLRGGASYGGGMDDSAWNDETGKSANEPIAQWGLPQAFVEREMGLRYGFADILKVRGDSMDDGTARGFSSGDRVIVDRMDTDPHQGGIFAVFDGNGVIIKQVELVRGHEPPRILCKSLNARYDPIPLILDGSVRIIGRVAGKISIC